METLIMSHFVQVSSHCTTFLGIDLHTTAATYAAIDAGSDTLEKVTIPNHCTGKILRFIQYFKKSNCIGNCIVNIYLKLNDYFLASKILSISIS